MKNANIANTSFAVFFISNLKEILKHNRDIKCSGHFYHTIDTFHWRFGIEFLF